MVHYLTFLISAFVLQLLDLINLFLANVSANRPKLYGNYAFPQNFNISKLVEITVFYEVELVHFGQMITLHILSKQNLILRKLLV